MRDIVLDDVAHEERRQVDADDGIDEKKPVDAGVVEACGEKNLYLTDDPVKHEGCNSGKKAHDKTEQERELLVSDVLFAPLQEALHGGLLFYA